MTKISEIEISKFQRISYAKINPTGSLIVLAGKNAQGKSSAIDAIESVLCGHNGRNITRPINDKAGKAEIQTTLDDGTTLVRKYTPSGTTLTVKTADGQKQGQKHLDGLIGSLGLDASRFSTLGEKEQLRTLLELVDLPFSPAELDAERNQVFTHRTDVNRRVKELQSQLAGFDIDPAGPTEEVSVSGLLSEYRAAEDIARQQQNDHSELAAAEKSVAVTSSDIAEVEAEIVRLQAEVKRLQGKRDEFTADVTTAKAVIAKHAPLPDLDAIQSKIDNAESINSDVRDYKAHQSVAAQLKEREDAAAILTTQLESIDKRKADGLAAATFPVEGLGFDAEGVLYQGIPFNRASSAEKIIVSAAMLIALDPELRTMVVRNGNDLDADSLQILEEIATDNDFQIFIELVAETGEHEYTFTEGVIA